MTVRGGAVVEPMRWWHVRDVVELESRLFPQDAWSAEQFWQELAQPTRTYVVAHDADGLLGYAGAFVMPPDSDLQTIAVRPDGQGHGVASTMLGLLVGEVGRAGATHMMLEVRSDNRAAIGLYSRRGFVRISTRRSYYPDGGDAEVMRLDVLTAGEVKT